MFLNIKTYQALVSVALLSYQARVNVLCTVFFGPLPRNFCYVQFFPGNAARTAQGDLRGSRKSLCSSALVTGLVHLLFKMAQVGDDLAANFDLHADRMWRSIIKLGSGQCGVFPVITSNHCSDILSGKKRSEPLRL